MTAVPKDPRISELRELFRHLRDFQSVYEATGFAEISTPYGNSWSLWDLEYLYAKATEILTLPQSRAISLCLVHNMREKDAAVAMGVSQTNPVMMYATLGIRRLLDAIDAGELPRFGGDDPDSALTIVGIRRQALHQLAGKIKSQIKIVAGGCWAWPLAAGQTEPRIMVRSPATSSGFLALHPMLVTYEAHVGPVPKTHRLRHRDGGHAACANPEHGLLALRHA